jgi:hypothetical protein
MIDLWCGLCGFQLVKSMNAVRNPDCLQKVPKKISISESGQILAVTIDCDSELTVLPFSDFTSYPSISFFFFCKWVCMYNIYKDT